MFSVSMSLDSLVGLLPTWALGESISFGSITGGLSDRFTSGPMPPSMISGPRIWSRFWSCGGKVLNPLLVATNAGVAPTVMTAHLHQLVVVNVNEYSK